MHGVFRASSRGLAVGLLAGLASGAPPASLPQSTPGLAGKPLGVALDAWDAEPGARERALRVHCCAHGEVDDPRAHAGVPHDVRMQSPPAGTPLADTVILVAPEGTQCRFQVPPDDPLDPIQDPPEGEVVVVAPVDRPPDWLAPTLGQIKWMLRIQVVTLVGVAALLVRRRRG